MNASEVAWTAVELRGETWTVMASDTGLCQIGLPGELFEQVRRRLHRHIADAVLVESGVITQPYVDQLAEYLRGTRRRFDCPIELHGTPFQLRVWQAMSEVPYGTTCSYRELARRVGQPNAPRAVGAAVGANPIPPVVPCHRIVASGGKLGGYRGGGPMKVALLRLEQYAGQGQPLLQTQPPSSGQTA